MIKPVTYAGAVILSLAALHGGEIKGRIYDPSRALVPGAMVILKNLATGASQSTKSGADGSYRLLVPSQDVYQLEILHPGMAVFRRSGITVAASRVSPMDAILKMGEIQETVEVVAQGTPQEQRPPARIRVGGNVQAAKLIHKVTPVYPPQAKEERRQGSVLLQAVILKDGTVGGLEAMPGADADLIASALDAVRQWRYSQTLLNGEPVEVSTTVQVNYSLAQ